MTDQSVNDAEAGQGEGEGGSPPRDKEREGLLAALKAEREDKQSFKSEVENLRKEIESLKQKPAKELSRSELQQLVDDGRISQEEADRRLHDQMKQSIAKDVRNEVSSELRQTDLARLLNGEIEKYTEVYPDLTDLTSENRRVVAEEYRRQVKVLGKPDNLQTELDALSAVFGPPHRLQKGKEKPHQTVQETGSDGGGEAVKGDGAPKDISAKLKFHYEKMIDNGFYKGWDDPDLKKELEYRRPGR